METARFFGLEEVDTVEDLAHDVMLGDTWRESAGRLEKWIEEKVVR